MPRPVTDASLTEKHKLLGLDHLRALAITFVFLYHYHKFSCPNWEANMSVFGWTGVDLFFVLSGFLIAGQLFNTLQKLGTISLREFFLKRFFRIIPPFLVVLSLYFFFPYVREGVKMAPLWQYLTFTLNLNLDWRSVNTFTHSWSLCMEEQFYLVLPLTLLLLHYFKAGKKAAYLLIFLFLAGFICRAIVYNREVLPYLSYADFAAIWHKLIYYPTYSRLDGLLLGVGVAGLFAYYPNIKIKLNRYGNVLLITGILLLISAYFVCENETSFNATVYGFPLISLAYAFIVAAAVCPSCILYNFKWFVTTQLATLSYSIYLVHKMMIHLTQTLLPQLGVKANGNLMFILCITSSVLGALVLRYAIGRPCLALRNKILLKWQNNRALKLSPVVVRP